MPVWNRFGIIKIEVISIQLKGLLRGNTVEEILFQLTIPIPKLRERSLMGVHEIKFKERATFMDGLLKRDVG
jgi:hypothetical protein